MTRPIRGTPVGGGSAHAEPPQQTDAAPAPAGARAGSRSLASPQGLSPVRRTASPDPMVGVGSPDDLSWVRAAMEEPDSPMHEQVVHNRMQEFAGLLGAGQPVAGSTDDLRWVRAAMEEPDSPLHEQAVHSRMQELAGLLGGSEPPAAMGAASTSGSRRPAKRPRARAAAASASRPVQELAGELRLLGYEPGQIAKIKQEALSKILAHHEALTGHGFTKNDICRIANRFQSLEVVAAEYGALVAAVPGLTREQIVAIARCRAGNLALQELLRKGTEHTVGAELAAAPLNLQAAQITAIASQGERPALEATHRLRSILMAAPLKLTPAQVVSIASSFGGKQALEMVKKMLPDLREAPYHFSTEQVVAIARNGGSKQALDAVKNHMKELTESPYHLSVEQVVAIASSNGGKQALDAVKDHMKELTESPYHLSVAQVVAIARKQGGKQALDAVKDHMKELTESPHHLSIEQVVAIASNHGGKQALDAVKTQMEVLRGDGYGLTTEQVVAIASSNGGKQALEAVKDHMKELTESPYHLSVEQVVVIASNEGGKPALEAVKKYMPALRGDGDGFTAEQVVDLACVGGRPALEALNKRGPQLQERFDKEMLLAIATLGGGQALQALSEGLPWAATRQSTRRVRAESSTGATRMLIKDAQHFMAVLKFFVAHPEPAQAFAQAREKFGMDTPRLLNLLARAGVTEPEALAGTLPDTAQRWGRVSASLEAWAKRAAPPLPAHASAGAAPSMENRLMSAGPAQGASPASGTKRAAEPPADARNVRPRWETTPLAQPAAASSSALVARKIGPRDPGARSNELALADHDLRWLMDFLELE